MSDAKHVYMAIVEVAGAMASEGIGKNRVAEGGGGSRYRFRGIDDVYNALAPHLAKAKLCILPRVLDRIVTERTTKSGGIANYVVLTVEFDVVSAVDGSLHTIRTMGEAMDTSDKATNKAMSAAYKYAAFQAFAIPTEGDNDTENANHEPAASNGTGGTDKKPAAKSDSDEAENRLADALAAAADAEALAKAQMATANAVKSGLLTDAARKRLLKLNEQAVHRLGAAEAS